MPAQGTKTVHLTFTIEEGPKYIVRDIDFVGNKAVGDRTLKRRMKETKETLDLLVRHRPRHLQGLEIRRGRRKGRRATTATRATSPPRVGNPEIRTLKTSEDGKTRDIQLVIPVSEGPRYKVGTFTFADNKVVKSEALKPIFKVKEGEYYSEKTVRKGLEKAREVYGSGGYWEMTGYPDVQAPGRSGSPAPRPRNGPPRPRNRRSSTSRCTCRKASSSSSTASPSPATP